MGVQLKQLLDIVYNLIVPFAQKVYDISQLTLAEIISIPRLNPITSGITKFLFETLGIGDVTLLSFMLISGATFYIAWTIISWLTNVLT